MVDLLNKVLNFKTWVILSPQVRTFLDNPRKQTILQRNNTSGYSTPYTNTKLNVPFSSNKKPQLVYVSNTETLLEVLTLLICICYIVQDEQVPNKHVMMRFLAGDQLSRCYVRTGIRTLAMACPATTQIALPRRLQVLQLVGIFCPKAI